MTDEKRQHERVAVDAPIAVRSRSVDEFVDRSIRDLSAGGVFLETAQPLEVGARVEFELRIEDEAPLIRGVGRVAWVRREGAAGEPAGLGVAFEELDGESLALVEAFVERRLDDVGTFEKGA